MGQVGGNEGDPNYANLDALSRKIGLRDYPDIISFRALTIRNTAILIVSILDDFVLSYLITVCAK